MFKSCWLIKLCVRFNWKTYCAPNNKDPNSKSKPIRPSLKTPKTSVTFIWDMTATLNSPLQVKSTPKMSWNPHRLLSFNTKRKKRNVEKKTFFHSLQLNPVTPRQYQSQSHTPTFTLHTMPWLYYFHIDCPESAHSFWEH